MAFHDARDLAEALGLALANPDADGPPIGALAWPGIFVVMTQEPAPGTPMRPGDAIRVTIARHGDGSSAMSGRIR